MTSFDHALLADTIQQLLREPAPARLSVDEDGWAQIDQLVQVMQQVLQIQVCSEHVHGVTQSTRGFEVTRTHIRVWVPVIHPPDILFHATTEAGLSRIRAAGELCIGGRRRIFLSADEHSAWRAAHRLDGPPRVVVVDTLRARRAGVRFGRGQQPGLWVSSPIPDRHLLNLREGYAEQWSAGGIPVRSDPDGQIRLALIQVTRRSGVTWEVAKGKLEPGEPPEASAVREVREEMGVDATFRVIRHVADIRYGFLAPGGAPRLKTIFLFLMTPQGSMDDFQPSEREGIGAVRWFTPAEACHMVTHSSLQPAMGRARALIERFGLTPAFPYGEAT